MSRFARVCRVVACLFNGLAAHAVPLTYDFAGADSVCTYATEANCASTYDGAFTGSISLSLEVRATSVPEPGTLVLFGVGLVGLGLFRRGRVRAS